MGHGLNMVTGDYSRGAAGFWVNGEIQHAVQEVTIAGNEGYVPAGVSRLVAILKPVAISALRAH